MSIEILLTLISFSLYPLLYGARLLTDFRARRSAGYRVVLKLFREHLKEVLKDESLSEADFRAIYSVYNAVKHRTGIFDWVVMALMFAMASRDGVVSFSFDENKGIRSRIIHNDPTATDSRQMSNEVRRIFVSALFVFAYDYAVLGLLIRGAVRIIGRRTNRPRSQGDVRPEIVKVERELDSAMAR